MGNAEVLAKLRKLILFLLIATGLAATAYFHLIQPQRIDEPALTRELQTALMKIGNLERSYHYYVPAKPQAKPPLIFVFHGSLSSGKVSRSLTAYQFDVLVDWNGIIVIYPDG